MDKKLTDSEIVKALECCIDEDYPNCSNCISVGCHITDRTCKEVMKSNALDLINRLQADCENYKQVAENQQKATMDRGFEIKRLKEKIDRLQSEIVTLNGLIGIKNDTIDIQFKSIEKYGSLFKTAKAEAYKEFAERLKTIMYENYQKFDEQPYPMATIHIIDNLLKEMDR